jgi:hypothetical protein
MASFFTALTPAHQDFIAAQKIYFVASAPADGRVNLSPKGLESFRVLSPQRVGYLDQTGSGNETAAHARQNGRVTIMFCAFEGAPLILRVYGRARVVHPRDGEWTQLRPHFGAPVPGERQLVVTDIESVQTSCGFGVPLFDFKAQRTLLTDYFAKKGPMGTAEYWAAKNTRSIDGLPTGLLDED